MKNKNYIRLGQIYQFLQNKISYVENQFPDFEALINNDFNINYRLPVDSSICQKKPEYSGNTALHFLVVIYKDDYSNEFFSKYLRILLKSGADLTVKNTNGFTPLLLGFNNSVSEDYNYFYEKTISLALLNGDNIINYRCKNGISHFHVLCFLNIAQLVEVFLKTVVDVNERVNEDSPKYPGYTPLHFAVLHSCQETTKLLISYGADLSVTDTHGLTPLHLIVRNFVTDRYQSRSLEFFQNEILDAVLTYQTDNLGFSSLHLGCLLNDPETSIDLFFDDDNSIDIDSHIKFESPLWPGCTPLHLASLSLNSNTVTSLLEKGADILAKDANGTTPLDLIIQNFCLNDVINILPSEKKYQFSQFQLTDGTLLLDCLQAMEGTEEMEHFITLCIKTVNTFIPFNSPVWPGYNLLHLLVLFDAPTDQLLRHGIDFTMLEASGMSPLHLAFRMTRWETVRWILDFLYTMPVNLIDSDNLSYLHVACAGATDDLSPVICILEKDVDPDLPTLCDFLWTFDSINVSHVITKGSTPLHIAVGKSNTSLANLLLTYGANPCVADVNGITPFQAAVTKLGSSQNQDHWEFQQLLMRMLKSHGKDLMAGKTGINIMREALMVFDINDRQLFKQIISEFKSFEELGFTRLHVACITGDYDFIKSELESGVDINRPIAFDSPLWPGDTPLHVLLRKSRQPYDDNLLVLLLAHEADVTLKNAENLTPLHIDPNHLLKMDTFLWNHHFTSINPVNNEGLSHFHLCCTKTNVSLIEEFLKSGVDVNDSVDYFAKQYAGYTPLHFAVEYMDGENMEVIELLLSYGADSNVHNANGYDPWHIALLKRREARKALLRSPNVYVYTSNVYGQTALDMILREYDVYTRTRNVVKEKVLEMLQWGYELCHKDNKGKTALHKSRNSEVITLLLSLGADVNIRDDEGKTPYTQCLSENKIIIKSLFIKHLQLLHAAGLYIDNLNRNHLIITNPQINSKMTTEKPILDSKLKNLINSSFSADYFFSEKFVFDYKKMPASQRETINNFCIFNTFNGFENLKSLITLQFRKALTRTRLLEPAESAFQALIDKFLPDCTEHIFEYLSNDDLMNLIRAGNGRLEFAPLPENF